VQDGFPAHPKFLFQKLNEIGYSGGITMQAARGENDISIAKEQLLYTLEIIEQL
jgi:hypothetical protein